MKENDLHYDLKWVTLKAATNKKISVSDYDFLHEYLHKNMPDDIKLEYGVRNEKIVHISEIEYENRGLACGCICPACNTSLQVRIGTGKKRPHFAHDNSGCSNYVAQQTALHMLAKEVLLDHNYLNLPPYTLEGSEGKIFHEGLDSLSIDKQYYSFEYKPATTFTFDNVFLEKKIDDIIPDIIIEKSGFDSKLIVEVAVTHFVDEVKKNKIIKKNISAIEIDISNLHKNKFDRKMLETIIIESIDSKEWKHNINYDKALLKLNARNKEIAEKGKKEQEQRIKEREKLMEEKNRKLAEKKEKDKVNFNNIKNALKVDNYNLIVNKLRNDILVLNEVKNMHFYKDMNNSIPFYMDIPITGEIAFKCDKRIWQMHIFDTFIYHRNENSTIMLAKIWTWVSKYSNLVNWDYIVKETILVGDKLYEKNCVMEAVIRSSPYNGVKLKRAKSSNFC